MDGIRYNVRPLQRARKLRGWRLRELAEMTGLDISTISRALAGETAGPAVKQIADALGVPMAKVLIEDAA